MQHPALTKIASLFLAVAALGLVGPTQAAPSNNVTVETGVLRGASRDNLREFLGIPYAQPPVGKLRWASPQPALAWQGERDATALRSKCTQLSWAIPKTVQGGEDCLYLNVYTPQTTAPGFGHLPVMVWFHGGGWVAGSSQDVDPQTIVSRENIIVITVNYRLGVFGFFASPALDAEDPIHESGNYAIRDEQAALRWIKRNIAAFGGDPGRVTLSGQSAGSISNWTHLVSPASDGLFHQVIAESGPVTLKTYSGEDSSRGVGGTKPIAEEEQSGPSSRLFAALGCQNAPQPLDCARSKSARDVLYAIDPANARVAGWGEVVDGVIVPAPVPGLISRGAYKKVPILTGFNVTEAGFGILTKLGNGGGPETAEEYTAQTKAMPHGDAILARYPLSAYPSPEDALIARSSDAAHCAMLYTAKAVSASTPLYMYEFNDMNPPPTLFFVTVPADIHPGAFHTSEIAYVFGQGYPNELRPGVPPFTAGQKALSDRMMHYWASFVKTGKPDSTGHWQAVADDHAIFVMSPQGDKMASDEDFGRQSRCEFWTSL